MASYDNTRAHGAGLGFGAAISALVARFVAWNDARVTRKALDRLSDHELDDIGLTRGDIDCIR